MATETVCQLADVHKQFGGQVVISELSLAVGRGEMVAIVGSSGCGKSTVLNMIGLLERPDAGAITLFGRRAPAVGSAAGRRLLRDHIGYLFQNFALIDTDTVEANLAVAQTYASTPRRERTVARAAVLQQVGLTGAQRRRVFSLSGGEQQRLAVARLMLKPCDLVLADEPTGSLDAGNRDAILAMLHDLHRSGKTIIIVTHDPVVASSCDRTVDLQAANRAAHLPSGGS